MPAIRLRMTLLAAMCLWLSLACGGGGGGSGITANLPTSPWPTPQVLDSGSTDAARQQIAMNATGMAVVVWTQNNGLNYDHDIWARIYTPGTGWGPAQLIEDLPGNAGWPMVAIADNGNTFAAWRQFDGIRNDLFVRRYTPSTGWETVSQMANGVYALGQGTDVLNPRLTMNATGDTHLVFELQYAGTWSTWWLHLNANLAAWWWAPPNYQLETDDTGDVANPQVAVGANGNAVAVWSQSDGTRENLWGCAFDPASKTWGTLTVLESGSGDALFPRVAMGSGSRALVVFDQRVSSLQSRVFFNHWTALAGWGVSEVLQSDVSQNGMWAAVAMNTQDEGLAAWSQFDGTVWRTWAAQASPQSPWDHYTRFESDQSSAAPPLAIVPFGFPALGLDNQGSGLVLWPQWGPQNDHPTRLFCNPFQGGTWGPSVLLSDRNDYDPCLAMNSSGRAIAAWTNEEVLLHPHVWVSVHE